MSDSEFQKLLRNLATVNSHYKSLLNEAVEELKQRYGFEPGEIDCDEWIDTFEVGSGSATVKEVDKWMRSHLPKDHELYKMY